MHGKSENAGLIHNLLTSTQREERREHSLYEKAAPLLVTMSSPSLPKAIPYTYSSKSTVRMPFSLLVGIFWTYLSFVCTYYMSKLIQCYPM